MKAKRIILIAAMVAGNVIAGESLRNALSYEKHADRLAAAALVKAEKAGTVLTQAQIDALVDQGKTKEALKAFFTRESESKKAVEKEKEKEKQKTKGPK